MNNKATTLVSLLSVLFSLVSVILSIFSLYVSNVQHSLDRSLILIGKYDENNSNVVFFPLDDKTKLLRAHVYYPPSFMMYSSEVSPEGYLSFIDAIEYNSKIFIGKSNNGIVNDGDYNFKIPVYIDSYYVTHGNSYRDFSLYYLSLNFRFCEKTKNSRIWGADLIFSKKYEDKTNYVTQLEMLFEELLEKKMAFLPARKPASDFWKWRE